LEIARTYATFNVMPTLFVLLNYLQRIKSTNRGFTLIEILITIGIITLIAAVVLPNLRNFNQQEGLNIAKASLFDDLRLAKSKADSGVICPGAPISITSLQIAHGIELRRDGYFIKYQCINDTSSPPIFYPTPNPATYKPYPVSTSVQMTSIRNTSGTFVCTLTGGTSYATINFKARSCPTGGVCTGTEISCTTGTSTIMYTDSTPLSMTLQNAQGMPKVISISPGGSIYEN
jgi:prepilin-type N-terminal cleavage/methylation domain-containing protein